MQLKKSAIFFILQASFCAIYSYCMPKPSRTFHLIKSCQRSQQSIVELKNVATLNECFKVAESSRALALNYSPLHGVRMNSFENSNDSKIGKLFPRRSSRRNILDQPEQYFNCHALQCPENSLFTTVVNDSRFDYYSLYGNPPALADFACLPGIGIFQLNLTVVTYSDAYNHCSKINGCLAHVASERRTIGLSNLLRGSDYTNGSLKLAYIGLNYTVTSTQKRAEFTTTDKDNLNCFLYRAWAPGHPKNQIFVNSSCVALTTDMTWMTVDCERKLPFICEIYTSPPNLSLTENSCDKFIY